MNINWIIEKKGFVFLVGTLKDFNLLFIDYLKEHYFLFNRLLKGGIAEKKWKQNK